MPLNSQGIALANLAAWHQTRLGDMGYLAAPPEGSTSLPLGMPSNPAATSRRVWLDEPPGAIPFNEQGTADLTGVAGTITTVLTVQVPAGFDGVIKWLANNLVGIPFVFGQVVWSLAINGRPIRNFGTITMENGTVAQGRQISPIRLFANNTLTFSIVEEVGGLAGMTAVSVTGYYYPSKGVS